MNTMATVGVLGVEAVAEVLGTTPLGVMRLVCRGQIPVTRTGSGLSPKWNLDQWRILAADVEKYIKQSAPDSAMPDMDASWFADIRGADAFPDALTDAFANQIPDTPPPNAKDGDIILIKTTPEINAVCQSRILGPWGIPDKENAFPADWRTAWLVQRVRRAARDVIGVSRNAGPLHDLYGSAGQYKRIVRAAVTRCLLGGISRSKMYLMDLAARGSTGWGIVHFEIAISRLAADNTMELVEDLAF